MSVVNFVNKGKEYARKAIEQEAQNAPEEAKRLYAHAAEALSVALKYEKNERRHALIKERALTYVARAEELAAPPSSPPASGHKGAEREGEDAEVSPALHKAIVRESPNVPWDAIAGLFEAKRLLKETVILPQRFPDLFAGERRPWSGILLYGPPGTGKSYLAKAVATEARGATFFAVSSADLVSKWVGESPKLVKQLFEEARQRRPAVIFLDEIDALCQSRNAGGDRVSEATQQLLTQLLLELEGVGNSMDGLLLLGATNVPWAIDAAMRRRLQKRIYIPLPEHAARAALFRIRLAQVPHALAPDDFGTLATLTEHFSGSDISNVVRDALMVPLRMAQDATHFKAVPGEKWAPCSPGDPEGVEMDLEAVPAGRLVLPTLTLSHFRQSIADTRPSVSAKELQAFRDWTREFGQDGV